jgi:hypothetical protein
MFHPDGCCCAYAMENHPPRTMLGDMSADALSEIDPPRWLIRTRVRPKVGRADGPPPGRLGDLLANR